MDENLRALSVLLQSITVEIGPSCFLCDDSIVLGKPTKIKGITVPEDAVVAGEGFWHFGIWRSWYIFFIVAVIKIDLDSITCSSGSEDKKMSVRALEIKSNGLDIGKLFGEIKKHGLEILTTQ